jgi:hypothetical protein
MAEALEEVEEREVWEGREEAGFIAGAAERRLLVAGAGCGTLRGLRGGADCESTCLGLFRRWNGGFDVQEGPDEFAVIVPADGRAVGAREAELRWHSCS